MNPSDKPSVFVVEDDAGVRNALKALLGSVGLEVSAFASAEDFLEALDGGKCGCLILDVRLQGMSGLELQQRIAWMDRSLFTIVISGHADVPMAVRAMKAGAVEFFEKPINEQRLLERVQRCLREAQQSRARAEELTAMRRRLERLTPRELEIFELVVAGRSSTAIAQELRISRKTVDVHRSNIMAKLEAKSVAELVRIAMAGSTS